MRMPMPAARAALHHRVVDRLGRHGGELGLARSHEGGVGAARPVQAARVAAAMSGRKRSSAASHTDARSTNMPAFQK
jgi:hypothetical protein